MSGEIGNRQRDQHARLVDEVRARAAGCATLVEIAAMHHPGLVVTDGYVLCSACRETWPCATTQTIQAAVNASG